MIVVFSVLIVLHFIINIVYRIYYPKCVEKKKHARAVILQILYRPFKLFLWLVGLSGLTTIYAELLFQAGVGIGVILKLGIVFAFAWAIYLVSRDWERVLLEKWHQDVTTVTLFSKVCLIGITVSAVLLTLPILGIPIGGLLAFGGVGGIIVGFATKDAFSNIFGGIVLALDAPFKVGEWIYTTDGKVEGKVEAIGWRVTSLRTWDKHILYVPNHLFSSMVYANRTRVTHFRIWRTFDIRYQDMKDIPCILQEVRKYINTRDDLDKNEMHFINLVDFGSSALKLELRVYVRTKDYKYYYRAMEEVLSSIYDIVLKCGGHMAYPTQTLYVHPEGEQDLTN